MGFKTSSAIIKSKDYPSASVTINLDGELVFKSSAGTQLAYATPTDAEKETLVKAWTKPPLPPPPPPASGTYKPGGHHGVGIYNVNNQGLRQGPERMFGHRVVFPRDLHLHEMLQGFKVNGVSSGEGGTGNYAQGNGGTIEARLHPMKSDGFPDLNTVITKEVYSPLERWHKIKKRFGFTANTGFMIWTPNVDVKGGVPYWITYRNVHSDPHNNWVSINSPDTSTATAGPHAKNTTDVNASGAILGLDPRECVAWTTNGGQNWAFGHKVGGGSVQWDYEGSATGDDGARLPHYGWTENATEKARYGQPLYAYRGEGSFTVTLTANKSKQFTRAGGYGPGIGTVTVKNLNTGVTAQTASLGNGYVSGPLSKPIDITSGTQYTVSNSGRVYKGEADTFLVAIFGSFPWQTAGHGYDRAALFAE